jgi:tetratricopeptide (TPR) repeat protein
MTPAKPPTRSCPPSAIDRRIAIEQAAGLLSIRHTPRPKNLDADVDLEWTVTAVIDRLGLGAREPVATLDERARLLSELLSIAVGAIDARWPQRIVTAACDLVDSEGVTDIDELRAFVAAFVQRSLDAQPARRSRHYRSAVEWADEVGYLYGSVHAERAALQAYRASLVDNPAHALDRLERALFHRSARSVARDSTLPEWRLAAAELCARLGRHGQAVDYFNQAWPALDALGDPVSERMIQAFRSAAHSARLAGDFESSSRYSLEVVRRTHVALERAVDVAMGAISPLVSNASELELELGIALAATGDIAGALRWAQYVMAADPTIVAAGSAVWVSARRHAALYQRALGQTQLAADILTAALAELRTLFGPDHAIVIAVERQLGSL